MGAMFTLPKTRDARMRYWAKRRRIMRDLLREGWTMGEIGAKYGITKQAVSKCLRNGSP